MCRCVSYTAVMNRISGILIHDQAPEVNAAKLFSNRLLWSKEWRWNLAVMGHPSRPYVVIITKHCLSMAITNGDVAQMGFISVQTYRIVRKLKSMARDRCFPALPEMAIYHRNGAMVIRPMWSATKPTDYFDGWSLIAGIFLFSNSLVI